MIERRPITSRAEWLAWRKQDLTASAIGALFGVHPYITALRLYAEKRGTEFPEADVDDMVLRRGRWLEPAIGLAAGEKNPQWQISAPKIYLRDPDLRLGGTPDFFIEGDARGLGVLECKSVAPSVYHSQWDSGREPPLWVTLQCAAQMMLADAAFGAVAVMLVDPHSMDVQILDVPRHAVAEDKIARAVVNFWQAVANGIEPTPDFGRDADVIAALRGPETPGAKIDFAGNNALPDMLAKRAELKDEIEVAEARCKAIETEIKFLMGDAEVATGLPDWSLTFKTTDYKGYSVPARSTRVLRIRDKRAGAP